MSVRDRLGEAIRAIEARYWDWRLDIRTTYATPAVPGGKAGDPTAYHVLFRAAAELHADDVLVDVGCGTGRACVVFARFCRTVRGIEFSSAAAELARRNGVHVIDADARVADYGAATVLWIYNPFGPEVLRSVLRQARTPRVLYYNASDAHRDVFLAEGYALVDRLEFTGLRSAGEAYAVLSYRLREA
jgi:SAM-dependent methyltransferase